MSRSSLKDRVNPVMSSLVKKVHEKEEEERSSFASNNYSFIVFVK